MASVLTKGFEKLTSSGENITDSFDKLKNETQTFQEKLKDVSSGLDGVDNEQSETNKKWKGLNKKLKNDIDDFEDYKDYYNNDFKPNHKWNR